MSRARNLADLLDSNGDVVSGALDNVPASNDASALTTGTLPIARIADGDVTTAKLASTLDLSGKTVTLPSGVVTPADVSDQANTSTGYFDMPTGTTAQRPGTANTGMVRYNSSLNIPEYYNGSNWLGFNESAFILPSEIAVTPTVFPNGGNYTGTFNDSNYYGARILVTNSDGTVQANDYEYGLDAKFNIRSSSSNDSFIQIYGWNGASPASFNASEENFFQVGLTWVSDVTTFVQTNSHEATSTLSAGDGAWCCSRGVGSYNWFFYNGGANDNSGPAGATNRETSLSLNWSHTASPILTIVVRGDSHPTAPRTISLYFGDNLQYTWNQTVPTGSTYLHPYVGIGYPSGNNTNWAYGQPKFRYGELTDGTRFSTT